MEKEKDNLRVDTEELWEKNKEKWLESLDPEIRRIILEPTAEEIEGVVANMTPSQQYNEISKILKREDVLESDRIVLEKALGKLRPLVFEEHNIGNVLHYKTLFIGAIFIVFLTYFLFNQNKNKTIEVSTFYDGNNGYSLSIPTGNESVCTWNYTGGNAAIPGIETTLARNTQKHIIYKYDLYDWKVSCVDDFGNHYVGKFK